MSKIDKSQVDSTILTEDDPAGASILDDLSDVTISSPVKGDTLVYQGSPAIWVPGATTQFVRKSVNEDVVSSTVLQDDDELVIPLPRLGVWTIEWWLQTRDLAVGAGYKQDFVSTGCGAPLWYVYQENTTSTNTALPQVGIDLLSEDVVIPQASGAGTTQIYIRMVARVTSSPSTAQIQLRWAQNVSDVTATRVEENSTVFAQHVG